MNITPTCDAWHCHLTVAAIIQHDGKFLIVEEMSDNQIVYNQPAGHVEANETVLAAVIRETLEETAWHFQPTAITGIYFHTNPQTNICYQRICFTGECSSHDPNRPLDQDIVRAIWLSPEELRALQPQHRSPMVQHCINDFLKGIRYPLELLTDLNYAN